MREYRVEVTPGQELVYPTPDTLRAAMHGGIITAESRIFHRAASTWVCITQHPEYRRYQVEISSSWFGPSPVVEPEQAGDHEAPQEPRVTRRRSGLLRGLAAIKKRFTRTSAAPAHNQPNQAGPRVPAPPRDHYTFLG
jgi:hypothetical protein